MKKIYEKIIKDKCSKDNYLKLTCIKNIKFFDFLGEFVRLCNPKRIFVRSDSLEDAEYIRKKAIEYGEERPLAIAGHTVHFDGIFDQGRDKEVTKYLLKKGVNLGKNINSISRTKGLKEIKELLRNSMKDREMIVGFFGLGPLNSPFFIPAVQLTDSFYVVHSEGILYRSAYEAFKKLNSKEDFFRFVHSSGVLEGGVSKDVDKKRIYIDLEEDTIYSVNTQYAGNTVGLKKLALRLAIRKASKEGWLAEHMLIIGVKGKNNRTTYFCGAFPSACGKTSTAMLKGETIVGDDIAYLRKIGGKVRAVNVERGIFGIIQDVNPNTDPLIWQAINTEGEVIFTNVLVSNEGVPYWLGDGRQCPSRGINFSGEWYQGKIDKTGNEIPPAHKNARYTISLMKLENCDTNIDNPLGVEIEAIIYGGRDSDIWPPVQQSFDWVHGVITMGASLESETTSATLGREGIRTFNLMSNLDFLSIPIGVYIKNHLKFVKGVKNIPLIFSVNYFLRDEKGAYICSFEDKRVWLKWMELRVHNEVEAIKTPTGFIPYYYDLKRLFNDYLNRDYSTESYVKQFTLRIPQNISKIDRIINIYKENVADYPQIMFKVLKQQKNRLINVQRRHGDYIDPFVLERISLEDER
ncbi:MAG: phosphoenolpyruvate carboxykinase (GTP) [Candidatus Omnitrophica bacterium]|nr:phosphoenolpyruvate carboxykinase (GTP) [Candidatus Omnitrophota bacterium]MCM8827407.1 phosphoenolpyruvate carboxykinase (GTP) [Candidatus Omnitrophota bacterium]